MKTYLYVDTENVGLTETIKVLDLNIPQLTIYFVYTNASTAIPMQSIEKFITSKHKLKFIYAQNGTKNALDFVLTAELTRQVLSAPKSLHIVFAQDTGYMPVIKHLRNSVCNDITKCATQETITMAYEETKTKSFIKESYTK